MRVIVGCEFSQTVTKAFRAKGHEAYSCDIIPCEGGHPEWHFHEDIFEVLGRMQFDLGIFHPPCTFLSNAGIRWFNEERYGEKAIERKANRLEAAKFFINLYHTDILKIAIENPVGWMNLNFRKPDQIVRPFYFGEPEQKNICLWLKGLPKLIYANSSDFFQEQTNIGKPEPFQIKVSRFDTKTKKKGDIKRQYFHDKSRDPYERSKFFPKVAEAMADQWGGL